MKIYNAQLVGISKMESKGLTFYHFGYKSKFVNGTGVIVVSEFNNNPKMGDVEINKHYDIYVTSKNGFNNVIKAYEHKG